jgi:hypothetical protein
MGLGRIPRDARFSLLLAGRHTAKVFLFDCFGRKKELRSTPYFISQTFGLLGTLSNSEAKVMDTPGLAPGLKSDSTTERAQCARNPDLFGSSTLL